MLKFNADNIMTGYIKQLLTSFNLPKYSILPKEQKYWVKNYNYINNNYICQINDNDEIINKGIFTYDRPIKNITKNLDIRNNIYDFYTHEYLGDYLRFQRDYNGINLMPLYNCFNNRPCPDISLEVEKGTIKTIFDSSDPAFKIYMLPVKLGQLYTIAIDCTTSIEVCCGFYGKYCRSLGQSKETMILAEKFAQYTYAKYRSTRFNIPVLYSNLQDIYDDESFITKDNKRLLAENEPELKLFIKVPATNTSSITILEGNYTNCSVHPVYPAINTGRASIAQTNKSITDKKKYAYTLETPTVLQLMKINAQESFPFSNRLIEYLIGNAITQLDENTDNIKRAQKVMSGTEVVKDTNEPTPVQTYKYTHYGLWDDKMQPEILRYVKAHKFTSEQSQDNLGYIDKDVEKFYKKTVDNKIQTISGTDIYEEDE